MKMKDLQLVATSLFEFSGYEVQPFGQTKLLLSLSTEPRRKTHLATFTVVDTPSSSNAILSRPILSSLQAVTFRNIMRRLSTWCKKEQTLWGIWEGLVNLRKQYIRFKVESLYPCSSRIQKSLASFPNTRNALPELPETTLLH